MTPLHEIALTRRIFELRESCPDADEFSARLQDELRFSEEESRALAAALEDRFVSPEEQLELLGRLELRGALAPGSSVGGLLGRLAGTDGREALRYRALRLTERLAEDPRAAEGAPLDAGTVAELAGMLPRGLGVWTSGGASWGTAGYGIHHYLRPEDSFLRALAEEIRGNWESATDPVLRMRSARVLAAAGDRAAAAFVSESEAACVAGGLPFEERIARACGLAADGHPAAIRFLQNLAMNPRAATDRRVRALSYLPPESLENGSDAGEVFRSLAEDPEEPVATRYLLLRLLARAPHPPDAAWWRGMMRDPSVTVVDRPFRSAGAPGEESDFSQWNLVLSALGESRGPWSEELLFEAMGDAALPAEQRREALMAYILHEGRGTLPWERLRGVLAAQSGWGRLLAGIEGREGELRLRFPARVATDPAADFDIRAVSCIGKEIVLQLREGAMGAWVVDFRPLDAERDALSSRPEWPEEEGRFPVNRRIFLDAMGLEPEAPPFAVAAAPAGNAAEDAPLAATPGDATPPRLASNETQRPLPSGPSHVQQNGGEGATNGYPGEEARGI